MNDQFSVVVGIVQPGRYRPGVHGAARQHVAPHHVRNLFVHVASLEVQDAALVFPSHPGVEVHEGCDGAGDEPGSGSPERGRGDADMSWTDPSELGDSKYKDDAKEVATGLECGISLTNFNDIQEGDILEVYIMEEIKK